MKTVFNYNKFNQEAQDTLVESFIALSNAVIEGKADTPEYKEANKQFNYDFMKECCSAMPGFNAETFSLEDMKNPMINGDVFVQRRFDTLLAQMITPVVPTIIAAGFGELYDVTVRLVSL